MNSIHLLTAIAVLQLLGGSIARSSLSQYGNNPLNNQRQKREKDDLFDSKDKDHISKIIADFVKECKDGEFSKAKMKVIDTINEIIKYFNTFATNAEMFEDNPIVEDFRANVLEAIKKLKEKRDKIEKTIKDCKSIRETISDTATIELLRAVFNKGSVAKGLEKNTKEKKPAYTKPKYPGDRKITIEKTIKIFENLKKKCETNSNADISNDINDIKSKLKTTMYRFIQSRGGEPNAKLGKSFEDDETLKQFYSAMQKSLLIKLISVLAKAIASVEDSKTCKDFSTKTEWLFSKNFATLKDMKEPEAFILQYSIWASVTEQEESKRIENNVDIHTYIYTYRLQDSLNSCDPKSLKERKAEINAVLDNNYEVLDESRNENALIYKDGKNVQDKTIDDLMAQIRKAIEEIIKSKDCASLSKAAQTHQSVITMIFYQPETKVSKEYKQRFLEIKSVDAFIEIFINIVGKSCKPNDLATKIRDIQEAWEGVTDYFKESASSIVKYKNKQDKIEEFVQRIKDIQEKVTQLSKKFSKSTTCDDVTAAINGNRDIFKQTYELIQLIVRVIVNIQQNKFKELDDVIKVTDSKTEIKIELNIGDLDFKSCNEGNMKSQSEKAIEILTDLITNLNKFLKRLDKNKKNKKFEQIELRNKVQMYLDSAKTFKQAIKKAKTCKQLQKVRETYNFIVLGIAEYQSTLNKQEDDKPEVEEPAAASLGNMTIHIETVTNIHTQCQANGASDVQKDIEKVLERFKSFIGRLHHAQKGQKFSEPADKFKKDDLIKNTLNKVQTYYLRTVLTKSIRIYKALSESKTCQSFLFLFRDFDFKMLELWFQLEYFIYIHTKEPTAPPKEIEFDPSTAPNKNVILDFSLFEELYGNIKIILNGCSDPETLKETVIAVTANIHDILNSLNDLDTKSTSVKRKSIEDLAAVLNSLITKLQSSRSCQEISNTVKDEFEVIKWLLILITKRLECEPKFLYPDLDITKGRDALKNMVTEILAVLQQINDRWDREEIIIKFSKTYKVKELCTIMRKFVDMLINSTAVFKDKINSAATCSQLLTALDEFESEKSTPIFFLELHFKQLTRTPQAIDTDTEEPDVDL